MADRVACVGCGFSPSAFKSQNIKPPWTCGRCEEETAEPSAVVELRADLAEAYRETTRATSALAAERAAHATTAAAHRHAVEDLSDERHGWAIVERALRDRLEVVEASLTSERAAHAATTAKLAESDKALDEWTAGRDRIVAVAGRPAEAVRALRSDLTASAGGPGEMRGVWFRGGNSVAEVMDVDTALRAYDQAGRGGEDETICYADPAEDHAQGVCDSTTCALCIAHAAECVRPECSCRRSLPRPVSP